ncbi:MAG: type II secretion system inner membrane protein GspF, partial [Deltaproteobacteria bacterium]|nr:type II secretion system inner membrane protein GspF [Deltaproteobacteria bacterium]
DSPRAARQKLRTSGLYPTALEETQPAEPREGRGRWQFKNPLQRVRRQELVSTTRQLATLLGAGLPLVTALNGVLEQVKKPALRTVLSKVRERVNEGMSLAAAMNEHPSVFPSVYTAMIHAGETSGTLELVMERLADFGEQELAIQRKVRSNLAYPVLMLLVGLGVVFFLMTYVIPRVTQIFADLKQTLPLPTIMLIQISHLLQKYWPLLLGLVVLLWFLARMYIRSEKGKRQYHRLLLRLPLLGEIVQKIIIARMTRTLGTLLSNGVPLLTSLDIVRHLVDNIILGEALDEARQDISEGASFSNTLAKGGIFPNIVVQMISVGEQSGNMEAMMLKIAETYEADVETRIATLTSLLEPIMILGLGGVVGFVVLAVLLPIFEMSHLVR